MMKRNIFSAILGMTLMTSVLSSCAGESDEPNYTDISSDGRTAMEFTFSHPSQSRVTDTSFEQGDVVGLFVTDAELPLQIGGNTVNNVALTFTGSLWRTAHTLYWDAGTYNAYAYYPRIGSIESITDLPFEVKADQRRDSTSSDADGYEASDFLYASVSGIKASADPVNMRFSHILSQLKVRLIKGEDFVGDIPESTTVYIHNTVTEASIDLEAGIATKAPRGHTGTIIARQDSPSSYSAIVVPQRLDNRVPLVEVVMSGISYMCESRLVLKPGMSHLISIVIDKNPDQIKIEIGAQRQDWY